MVLQVPGERADGLLQGLSDQFAGQVLGHHPADNPAGAKVDDDGEIESSSFTGDKRNRAARDIQRSESLPAGQHRRVRANLARPHLVRRVGKRLIEQ